MNYQKPEITPLANAADAIQAIKLGVQLDSVDPNLERRAGAGYESDE